MLRPTPPAGNELYRDEKPIAGNGYPPSRNIHIDCPHHYAVFLLGENVTLPLIRPLRIKSIICAATRER